MWKGKKGKKIGKLSTHLLMRDDDEHKSSSSRAVLCSSLGA